MVTSAANLERKASIWVTVWEVLLIVTGIIAIMQPAAAAGVSG